MVETRRLIHPVGISRRARRACSHLTTVERTNTNRVASPRCRLANPADLRFDAAKSVGRTHSEERQKPKPEMRKEARPGEVGEEDIECR